DKRYNAFDSQNGNFLQIIQSNASRLSLLIDQTLDIAKIENNSLHLNKLRCNLNKEIQTIVDEYNTKLLKSKYKIYDDNDSQIRILFSRLDTIHPIFVNMDKLRIYQVITNLINNSIKSIEDKNDHIVNDDDNNKKKDGVITISIKLLKSPLNIYKDDNSKSYNLTNNIYNDVTNSHGKYEKQETKQFAIINIKDSGKGISKEIMSKIFTKFGSFSDKGVGFGLFISKHIIEAHGGKIWAQNNFNNEKNGATFSFSLPVI
ncbi:MAG TPA: HAMP domain-containing sensor histidine kinase, partial [Candidatus Nitrosocosmicus sp.]